MTKADAARHLTDLLKLDLVGDCLDALGDHDARDLALKLICRCREIASDEQAAARRLAPPTGAR